MRRLAFTPNVGAGHLVVQRRPGYNIVQSRRTTEGKGKQIVGSTNSILEERPPKPSPNMRKIISEKESHD